ncbi:MULTISPECIES: HipA domain-containing protein [unclassified Oceanispirochaeta]|uniref:HipA domain-containing protein n=1 Tax=unclassified Oceanispirochaeta TaxID=2635722 RepID=UPI000E09DD93|nr:MULTISPECIES: HipA domain-containing protein [unclassified Oceanispirochaeta]MBF9015976.1 HipA domain-containing protein [Oceanispirochaeta sp. M2]NPD72439.1 HipA domain-containing protein [Oceanispirochaeta sp. M1]RDG32206.1 HipA domain-containing protein [Oceanispirochaeta sp. M1]
MTLVLFSYLSGNSDMHLKNYSLIYLSTGISLAPAYDLLNTCLVLSEKEDPEESALSINGKRRKLKIQDFVKFAESLKLREKQLINVHKRFNAKREQARKLIEDSVLEDSFKQEYLNLFNTRISLLTGE